MPTAVLTSALLGLKHDPRGGLLGGVGDRSREAREPVGLRQAPTAALAEPQGDTAETRLAVFAILPILDLELYEAEMRGCAAKRRASSPQELT
ncbi:hypothetical protein [Streptomyces sp. NPDC017868]|uniref:hypothetical protein n=1 Tax=Streptomyces sp. NPDC017868 TaxID=3365014 RepID=UPI0037957BF4